MELRKSKLRQGAGRPFRPNPTVPLNDVSSRIASDAKRLAVGIWCGVVNPGEVEEWAAAVFAELPAPPDWVVELGHCADAWFIDVAYRLNDIARRGGCRRLEDRDLWRLLDRFGRAIDTGDRKIDGMMAAFVLLAANARPAEPLSLALRFETSRFEQRFFRDHRPDDALTKLREWLDHVRKAGPTAA